MKMILLFFFKYCCIKMRFGIQRSSHCHCAEGKEKKEGLEENYCEFERDLCSLSMMNEQRPKTAFSINILEV